jgi:thioester reductase-like protein
VAERLVHMAAEGGLPITVHRPGRLVGDATTHAMPSRGVVVAELLRACFHVGALPRLTYPLDMVPVDYAARAIAALARREEALGRVFNLTNPEPVPPSVVLDGFALAGYHMPVLEPADWYARLVRRSRADEEEDWSVALALLGPWVRALVEDRPEPRYVARAGREVLGDEVVCPVVDAEMIAGLITRFAETAFLSGAGHPPAAREVVS